MRQYKFDKPLVETTLPVRDTRAYYVDVDEKTSELANIMEFKNGQWQVKHFVDDIDIWERSSTRLDIPNKIKLNPGGIIAAWLNGSEYESDVKEAAANASLSYVIGALDELFTVVEASITVMENQADAATAASQTSIADALSAQKALLAEKYAAFENSDTIADLRALAAVIDADVQ